MPAPRPSQAFEAARAAEFNEKKWVWVPDDRDGYVAGWVQDEDENDGDIVLATSSEIRRVPLGSLSKMNPPKFDRVDDMADLTYLNEASVVHNLKLRYEPGDIYTYSGLFLVAINPYTKLPIYSDATIQQYRGKGRDDNPPHIFAIAERAWVSMCEQRENQSILITGESGAGKTENTKKVIQYLAAIANRTTQQSLPISSSSSSNIASSSSSFRFSPNSLSNQILQTNPILEAFGNAQTARNNNSSRFGKFVRISFSHDGSIAGAYIDWYLLEKSRVVIRSEVERCFHVFYQLLAGGGALKDSLLLEGGIKDYEYLNKSRSEVDGVNDKSEFNFLVNALEVVGFSQAEQFDLFRIVAAILHIGNIGIQAIGNDSAQITGNAHEKACHLLGVPIGEFTRAVLKPQVLAGREWVTQSRTKTQAVNELGALCKTLYEKMFGALVERVNKALERPGPWATFIGVLDIAGFEIFQTNGFEQLCINYTNEKLQQFFNHHMFVLEQEEYQRESIEWDYVNFGLDLQPTIDLIESSGPTVGILSCLDEECIMPRATDITFTDKLNTLWAGDANDTGHAADHKGRTKYAPVRFELGFTIQHYAGDVEYRTDGWLEKNKDPLNDNLTRLLSNSTDRYTASLFADYKDVSTPGGYDPTALGRRRVLKKGAFRTVSQRHKEQLSSLMTQLQATQPHFVRCIVPNGFKKPLKMDVPLVLDQLRCNGVLEGIRIARMGYPNRLPFVEFRQRYELLTPGILPRGYMNGRQACERMLSALDLDRAFFKIGNTKVFVKAGVLAELEERRDSLLSDLFTRLQAAARRYTARRQIRKILNRAVALKVVQRNARLYGELRDWPWWQLYTKVRPLLTATRNDEELRKKDAELQLAKVQAERDQQEKEALAKLRSQLEQDVKKAQEDLDAERLLGVDKDTLLERSKKRESDLEEDVIALQLDLDTLDSQLDRAMKAQKATEANYEKMREALDGAVGQISAFESEQKAWHAREAELTEQLRKSNEDSDGIRKIRSQMETQAAELKALISQKDEDIQRGKSRWEKSSADLESKLVTEQKNRELLKSKVDAIERDHQRAKTQIAELTQTGTEYSQMLQQKEAAMNEMTTEQNTLLQEMDTLAQKSNELQAQLEAAEERFRVQSAEKQRETSARVKLQRELDDLRNLVAAKASEDTRRLEVQRSKEKELTNLRAQSSKLQQDLDETQRSTSENLARMKIELEQAVHDKVTLEHAHKELLSAKNDNASKRQAAETALADIQRTARALEADLQSSRTRLLQAESDTAEVTKQKEALQRELVKAHSKSQDFEDAVLQIEREKGSWTRQMESTRKQLDSESYKRAQLEQAAKNHNTELAKLKDRSAKMEKELNKALNDVHDKDWQIKQLVSKQDKTIVEHVHVLEEAKKRTDRELHDLKIEMQNQASYIKSLEKIRTRMSSEAEDLHREAEKERQLLRTREKNLKGLEDKASQALTEVEKERKLREATEMQSRRYQADLHAARLELQQTEEHLAKIQLSKSALEEELSTLAAEGDVQRTVAELTREYEARIQQLHKKYQSSPVSDTASRRIMDRIDHEHKEIRKLIAESRPRGDPFASRLLRELDLADQELKGEFSQLLRNVNTSSTANKQVPASKNQTNVNGISARQPEDRKLEQRPSDSTSDLRPQVQTLEQQIRASERVRQHLEASMREIARDLEASDGSKASLQRSRNRLAKDNEQLLQLLEDESKARRSTAASQLEDINTLWTKFQGIIDEERANYVRLEESRRALVAKQRTDQVDLDDHREQVRELTRSKKQLHEELSAIKDRIELEVLAKNDEMNARRKAENALQELKATSSTSSAVHTELKEAAEMYKSRAESYMAKLENSEIERAKATRAEAAARKTVQELEGAHANTLSDLQTSENNLRETERQLMKIQAKQEEDSREINDFELFRRRLIEEMEDERDQHQKDLAEREFTLEQTRKKYQGELAQSIDEIQSLRDSMSRLREENRLVRSELDDLQLKYDDELYSGGTWKKEKDRLDAKIATLSEAYEAASKKQTDAQTQVVSLLSQVRELRTTIDEANAERANMARARKALQDRMKDIAQDHLDNSQLSSDRELQALHLEKLDLTSALEAQNDKVTMASERLKKAEAYANESQIELNRTRDDNATLERANANLENQVKELNLRIVDLETKAYSVSSPMPARSRRLESRIEELTGKLNQEAQEKSETMRNYRDADKSAREIRLQLTDSERQRLRLQEELKGSESKVLTMRKTLDELQNTESNLQLAKRRAEREAAEFKHRALESERELERLKSRLERPSSLANTPVNSPSKAR